MTWNNINNSNTRCSYHPYRNATTTCVVCGKPICDEDIKRFPEADGNDPRNFCFACYPTVRQNALQPKPFTTYFPLVLMLFFFMFGLFFTFYNSTPSPSTDIYLVIAFFFFLIMSIAIFIFSTFKKSSQRKLSFDPSIISRSGDNFQNNAPNIGQNNYQNTSNVKATNYDVSGNPHALEQTPGASQHETNNYCTKCGASVLPDENFCTNCGNKIF